MRRSFFRPVLASILAAALFSGGRARAGVTPECVVPGDHYGGPAYGLDVVDLGKVSIIQAVFPNGVPAPLGVDECSGDAGLDVFIRWSEAGALSPAIISFALACPSGFPVKVSIDFSLGTPSATWHALDGSGAVVDTQVTPAAGGLQTVGLSHAAGIRGVAIEGSEICIARICWTCDPSAEAKRFCATATDSYEKPEEDVPVAALGPIRISQSGLPDGTPVPLDVEDCNRDGGLDIVIPWSEEGASPPAAIHFRAACEPDSDPTRVLIAYRQGVLKVEMNAYDATHALVDSETTYGPGPHVAVLQSPAGISSVEVVGAEICVTRVCWECGPNTPPPDRCTSVAGHYSEVEDPVHAADLGSVLVTEAKTPEGDPVPMSIRDCDDDGDMDLAIRWSGADAAPMATIHVFKACGADSLPDIVTVRILTDNAVLHAYDAFGVEVDTAAAAPVYAVQSLTVSHPGGIARIGIEGSQMCLLDVCWRCGGPTILPRTFRRGDSNSDGQVNISDPINTLSALFSGAAAPLCFDAADANDDAELNITDPLRTLRFLFGGGDPLPGGPDCALDLTPDDLTCEDNGPCPGV
jgi:hypothetical protein